MTTSGVYRHYKGGLYRVLFTAREATNGAYTDRSVVVYVSLAFGHVNVRDEVEFHARVTPTRANPDGVPRFELLPVAPPHVDEEFRCAVCGWPLAESVERGCVRGNCSHRPRPDRLYAPERAEKEQP